MSDSRLPIFGDAKIQEQDSANFFDCLRIIHGLVTGGHNLFGPS
jgi:hypothetical protein